MFAHHSDRSSWGWRDFDATAEWLLKTEILTKKYLLEILESSEPHPNQL